MNVLVTFESLLQVALLQGQPLVGMAVLLPLARGARFSLYRSPLEDQMPSLTLLDSAESGL